MDLLVVANGAGDAIAERLRSGGFEIATAHSPEEAGAALARRRFDAALIDGSLPDEAGWSLFRRLRETAPECAVVLLIDTAAVQFGLEALRLGAHGYRTKPCPDAELELLLRMACETARLQRENLQLRSVLGGLLTKSELIGRSPEMESVRSAVGNFSAGDGPVLIVGERGTGRKVVARAIHDASSRCGRPFIVVDCAVTPADAFPSMFFGACESSAHADGADSIGKIALADCGTIVLDNVDSLSPDAQTALLSLLQNGTYRRNQSQIERRVDVRVIALSTGDLPALVGAGKFNSDLFARFNSSVVTVPPLRERKGDASLLAEHLLGPGWTLADDARSALDRFEWPGNVRQLSDALCRAKYLAEGQTIRVADLPAEVAGRPAASRSATSGGALADGVVSDALSAVQRSHIVDILRRERGNKARTARTLGINRRSLYRLLEKHRIEPTELQLKPGDTDGAAS